MGGAVSESLNVLNVIVNLPNLIVDCTKMLDQHLHHFLLNSLHRSTHKIPAVDFQGILDDLTNIA